MSPLLKIRLNLVEIYEKLFKIEDNLLLIAITICSVSW